MMQFMRNRMGEGILVALVALIGLGFVFSGVFTGNGGGGVTASDVATVDGDHITIQQLQNATNREIDQYRSLGMDLPPEMIANVRRNALNGLIQSKLMVVEARKLGIEASDREVQEEIRTMPYFQDKEKGGSFNVDLYRKTLTDNGLSPSQFEDNVRDSLTYQRMQKFLSDRIRVTPLEVEREYKISNNTRDLAFVRFSREEGMKKLQVKPADIDAFLGDKSKEAQINGYYAQNNVKFNQPEKVCARHILMKAAPGSDDKTPPKAFTDLKPSPANFADLAKKHSEDPGSKTNGGDLECFGRGVMDKAFEEVAFSQPVGKVSAPVKSQFGWHYILVSKKIAAVNQPLEKVRREIAEELIKRERVDEIRKINQSSAEAVAKNWNSAPGKLETGSFSSIDQSIPKIGRADEIMKAAFDPNAKIQTGPQLFESQGGYIVAQVKTKKVADMAKLPAEASNVTKSLRERKLRAFLPAWMEDVQKRAKISMNNNVLSQM
jgi:peptidyl-prolyl cis-trans isomerase D